MENEKKYTKEMFTVKILFNNDGEDFQETLERIIFNRIKKSMEE